jgi:colanic acid biosynthesis protein WcaH
MLLPESTFKTIVASTPLISIDLVVTNSRGLYLLGFRNNKPAQGFWFVSGGRILKDESIKNAFIRLVKNELGVVSIIDNAKFMGVYEHFYSDNAFDNNSTTHYVVLGYQLELDVDLLALPDTQHSRYQWFCKEELLSSKDVHKHSKWYLGSNG